MKKVRIKTANETMRQVIEKRRGPFVRIHSYIVLNMKVYFKTWYSYTFSFHFCFEKFKLFVLNYTGQQILKMK